jgi:beta-glucosidase/6-phospho-beta-glucosidase/beta-galactosidase
MGFNSKESFTKVDENSNVADRVRVEMMELKLVEIKKATEEGTGGEGQTPFSEIVE